VLSIFSSIIAKVVTIKV